ncbi:unnamed protein product [Calypogeia fissa]
MAWTYTLDGRSYHLKTGAVIPALGLGTGGGMSRLDTKVAVLHALHAGYRHLDCSPIYGNEVQVGEALKEAMDSGLCPRADVFVTSKLPSTAHDPGDVMAAVLQSLRDLGLDYLDLYLIHWPVKLQKKSKIPPKEDDFLPLDIPGTWQAMENLVERGFVRSIGVSNFSCKKLQDLLSTARIPPAVNQVEMHPGWNQKNLIPFCRENLIHVTAYSPLGAPHLGYGRDDVIADRYVDEEAKRLSKSPAQVLVRWGLQQGVSVIPKSSHFDHILDNQEVWNWSICEESVQRLSTIEQTRQKVDYYCNETTSPYKTAADFWDGEV